MVELRGLVGVMMGRGAPERDMRLGLRAWTMAAGEESMAGREEAAAEAAMSVSESIWAAGSVALASWRRK